jgi:hypothetical protein
MDGGQEDMRAGRAPTDLSAAGRENAHEAHRARSVVALTRLRIRAIQILDATLGSVRPDVRATRPFEHHVSAGWNAIPWPRGQSPAAGTSESSGIALGCSRMTRLSHSV